jgi:hypothetical protein
MGIEGIDSAVPIRYTYSEGDEGRLYKPTSTIPARPKDWFENGNLDDDTLINLREARRWFA